MLKTNKKILGLDYGDKSIGLSLYDIETDFFSPYKTIYRDRKNIIRKSIREIVDIIIKNNVSIVVLGMPLNEDGSENERCTLTREFKELLNKRLIDSGVCDVKIDFINEFNTTYEAKEYMKEYGFNDEDIKKNIDTISSLVILKDYINMRENENGK